MNAVVQTPDLTHWKRFNEGGHPDYLRKGTLSIHVSWCVWHQGIPAYRRSNAIEDWRRIKPFKRDCVAAQSHNHDAAKMIARATDDQVHAVRVTLGEYFSSPDNGGYQMLRKHMRWLMYHEEMRDDFVGWLDNSSPSDFLSIRTAYHSGQDHNPHVRNLIAASSNSTIRALIDELARGPVVPY